MVTNEFKHASSLSRRVSSTKFQMKPPQKSTVNGQGFSSYLYSYPPCNRLDTRIYSLEESQRMYLHVHKG